MAEWRGVEVYAEDFDCGGPGFRSRRVHSLLTNSKSQTQRIQKRRFLVLKAVPCLIRKWKQGNRRDGLQPTF